MEPPPTQTIARFPSNVFSASKAPFPWYKSLGNVNLAIVQNPFLVLLLMDSSGRSDQQNFCFSYSLFEPPFVFCFRLCYYYNKLFQGLPIQK